MAFCNKCGNRITAGQKFCIKCGEPVNMSYKMLVQDALSGDGEATAELYRRTYQEKYYIALKYMKNREDAEDVLQDSYVRAFEHLGSLQDPERFPSWLSMIVANTAKNALAKKNPVLFTDLVGDNEEFDEDPILRIEDMDLSTHPEAAYLESERRELLSELLGSLTEEQRMAVMMFYVEELGTREIASALEVNENTVKSRLFKARKALQKKADELMKRGYVFSVAPLPFLVWLLRSELWKVTGGGGAALSGMGYAGPAGGGPSLGSMPGHVSVGPAVRTAPPGPMTGTGYAPGTGTASTAASGMPMGPIAGSAGIPEAAAAAAGAGSTAAAAGAGGAAASVGAKIAVIAAVAVLTGGAVFGGIKGVQFAQKLRADQNRETGEAAISMEDAFGETGASDDAEPKNGSAVSGETGEGAENEGTPSGEPEDQPGESAGNTESPADETEEAGDETTEAAELSASEAEEQLTDFLEGSLIPEKGVFNPFQISYGVSSDGMTYRFKHSWNAETGEIVTESKEYLFGEANFPAYRKEGIVSRAVEDFDGDGLPELLVIYGEAGLQWNQSFSAELYAASAEGAKLMSTGSLKIPGRTEDMSAPVTEIYLVTSESGKKALMLYYQGKHSDVSISHEACVMLPSENFTVEKQFRAKLAYESGGMPEAVLVTGINQDLSEGEETRFDFNTAANIDDQARQDVCAVSGYTETALLTADHWDGVRDGSSFLENYMLFPEKEDFTQTAVTWERDTLEYTEEDRWNDYDAEIRVDTVRFYREDGEYSAILEKINAVISDFTGDIFEDGSDPASTALEYTYTLEAPIVTDEYISVKGHWSYYSAGAVHGWGSGRSWVFSLTTGDPVDIRDLTGLSASRIAERITKYFKDTGVDQQSIYQGLGMEYVSDVSAWETDEHFHPEYLFRNIYITDDGWICLENVCSPPASGGNSFPSRVGALEEFDLDFGKNGSSETAQTESSAQEIPPQESTSVFEEPTKADGGVDYLADSGTVVERETVESWRKQADYLIVNIDEKTGKVIRIGYTGETMYGGYYACCFWYHGDTLTFPYLYVADGPYPEYQVGGTNAKEIVDNFFTYGNEAFASGGRAMVIWDSPYGLCAYDHRKSEYGGDTEALGYTFDTEDFEAICRSIGLDMSYIPASERQN